MESLLADTHSWTAGCGRYSQLRASESRNTDGNRRVKMGGRRLPDEHEAAVGATVAAANAAELQGDADTLAAADRYGSALSLTVLAFEESVKARTLGAITAAAVQGRRPGFSDDDLKKIIYNSHQARHAAARSASRGRVPQRLRQAHAWHSHHSRRGCRAAGTSRAARHGECR